MATHGVYQRIYAVIRRVPAGRVVTYGQVAELASLTGHARQVGYALSALPDQNDVPWHRVVNAKGQVSTRSEAGYGAVQRALLAAEGVNFDEDDRIDLTRHRWRPRRGGLSR